MNTTTIEIFYNFLKAKDAFEKYKHNYYNQKHLIPLNQFFNNWKPLTWMDAAFTWAETPEGITFWYLLNKQWRAKIIEVA